MLWFDACSLLAARGELYALPFFIVKKLLTNCKICIDILFTSLYNKNQERKQDNEKNDFTSV